MSKKHKTWRFLLWGTAAFIAMSMLFGTLERIGLGPRYALLTAVGVVCLGVLLIAKVIRYSKKNWADVVNPSDPDVLYNLSKRQSTLLRLWIGLKAGTTSLVTFQAAHFFDQQRSLPLGYALFAAVYVAGFWAILLHKVERYALEKYAEKTKPILMDRREC